MKDPNIQPGGVTTWNNALQRYDFQGTIPNVGGILPLVYTTPSLPLVGTLESKLSAGLFFVGSLQLNGQTTHNRHQCGGPGPPVEFQRLQFHAGLVGQRTRSSSIAMIPPPARWSSARGRSSRITPT